MSDFNENIDTEQTDKVEPDLSASETAKTEEPSVYAVPELVEGVETAKKKSKGSMVAITTAAVIAVLAAGSACAYAFVPTVKNKVKMLISSPENYYAWVEEQNIKETANVISEAYGNLLDSSEKMKGAEGELKIDLDPENAADLISEITGTAITESGLKLPSNIAVKYGIDADGKNTNGIYQVTADDSSLVSMNMYMRDGKYYYQVPELSSSYVLMDIQSVMNEAISQAQAESPEAAAFLEGYLGGFSAVSAGDTSALEEMLSEDELNDLIVTYFTKVFENINDVKLEKNYSCEVSGVESKYTKLTANVDQGALFSALKGILNEAEDDDTLIKIAEKAGVDKDTYSSAISELLDKMGSLEVSGGETMLTMNVYVNSKGVICGRDIEIPEANDVSLGYIVTENGSETAFEVKAAEGAADVFVVTGKSDENGDKHTGNVDIQLVAADDDGNDINIPIRYKDIEIVNDEKGYCKGEFTIDLSANGIPAISFLLDSDGKGQTIKSDIAVDGTNYGSISMTVKEENTIEIPEFDESQKVYEYTEDGTQMQEYLSEASKNVTTLIDNVGSLFGVDGLGQLLGAAYAGGVDDMYSDIDPITDDYDDLEFDTTNDIKYDFSKLKLQINGQDIVVPAKISGILDMVTVPDKTIEPDDFKIYTSDDYTLSVSVVNNTEAAIAPAECAITGINVIDGSSILLSIDGFTIGSNISDIAAKYGVTLDDPQYGYIVIYDTASDWNEISFSYMDGKVDSLGINIY